MPVHRPDIQHLLYAGVPERYIGSHGTLCVWFDSYNGTTEVTYVAHPPVNRAPLTMREMTMIVRAVDDRVEPSAPPVSSGFGVRTADDLEEEEMRDIAKRLTKLVRSRGVTVSTIKGDVDGDVMLVLNRRGTSHGRRTSPTRRRLHL